MADLRDQMLKAGLISEDQAKRGAHEKRQRNKQLGRDGREQEEKARREEVRRADQQKAQQDKQRASEHVDKQKEKEHAVQEKQRKQALIERALAEGALPRWEGQRTYYFRDGKEVLYLLVIDEAARLLESGKAAIVRGPGRTRYTVIQSGAALELVQGAPERVVTFHR